MMIFDESAMIERADNSLQPRNETMAEEHKNAKSFFVTTRNEAEMQKLQRTRTVQQVFNEMDGEWGKDPKTLEKFVK